MGYVVLVGLVALVASALPIVFLARRGGPRASLWAVLLTLSGKADGDGRFTPESVWTAWKDWEFGLKKVPSRWATLLAWRIVRRRDVAAAAG